MEEIVTRVTYLSDGMETQYTIPFVYLQKQDIKLYINGYPTVNFKFLSNNIIKLGMAPDEDSKILIQRETSLLPLVTYHDATNLSVADLNLCTLQAIYLIQEGHNHITVLENTGLANNEEFVLPPIDALTLLGILQGRIGALELQTGINDKIQLIVPLADRMLAAEGLVDSLTTQVGQLVATPWSSTSTYVEGDIVSNGGKLYRSLQADNLYHLVTDEVWWLKISDNADIGAMVTSETSARQNDTAALAYQDETFLATFTALGEAVLDQATAVQKTANTSKAYYKKTIDALATEASARVLVTEELQATLDDAVGRVIEVEDVIATPTSAFAQKIAQVSTTLNGKTTSIEEMAQTVDGTQGIYTVKIDTGGRMVGFSLISNAAVDDEPADSAFIVKADKFAVGYPSQTGVYPFMIGAVRGQSVVGINGNLLVDGTVMAQAIETGSLLVGDNIGLSPGFRLDWSKLEGTPNVSYINSSGFYTGNLDAASGTLNGNISSTADDALRYSSLTKGDLIFYKRPTVNDAWVGYKYMKQVQTGSGVSGYPVTLYNMDRKPEVLVSIRDLVAYKKEYAAQDQRWNVRIDDSGVVDLGGGNYQFTPVAQLTLAAASQSLAINFTQEGSSSSTLTSPTQYTPANTTSIGVSGYVNSSRGTGVVATYNYRNADVRLYYRVAGSGSSWVLGSQVVPSMGADFNQDAYNLSVSGLGSATYEYYVQVTYADAGGSFSTGGATYDYLTDVKNSAAAGNQVVINNESGSNAYSPLGHLTLPAFTPQPGYSVYEVNYSSSAAVTLTTLAGGSASAWNKTVSGGADLYGAVATKAWTSGSYSTDVAYSCNAAYGTAQMQATSASATIKTRKLQSNSETPSNSLVVGTATCTLSTSTVLDNNGVINWIAVA